MVSSNLKLVEYKGSAGSCPWVLRVSFKCEKWVLPDFGGKV